MKATTKRIAFTVDNDLLDKLTTLKKSKFYDVSWSELFRVVMEQGIRSIKEK